MRGWPLVTSIALMAWPKAHAAAVFSLLTLLDISPSLAAGNTLSVKTSGTDSASCTAAAPCQTISHAVLVANSGDTISVGAGTFVEGDSIAIGKDITIAGGWFLGTKVSLWIPSQKLAPVFSIGSGATVKLTNLTISGGNFGGISNFGNLELTNVWITNNRGKGGIANSGSLTMANVAIDHNSGTAGLINDSIAIVADSHIEGTYREAYSPGGDGVYNSGTLIVTRGLIAGNEGHGLQHFSFAPGCTTTTYLLNVTISGNHTTGIKATWCGQLILRHVTVAANTAVTGAGGLEIGNVTPVLENSIVAKNSGKQCYFADKKNISIWHSLVGDDSCTTFLFPDPTKGNLVGIDSKLSDALAYRVGENWIMKLFHIGANRVHALLPGSPAIDSGADDLCTDPFPFFNKVFTDQLGVQRPIDGDGDGVAHCDMGAYEYQPPSTGGVPR